MPGRAEPDRTHRKHLLPLLPLAPHLVLEPSPSVDCIRTRRPRMTSKSLMSRPLDRPSAANVGELVVNHLCVVVAA